jgi:hypothetical protein
MQRYTLQYPTVDQFSQLTLVGSYSFPFLDDAPTKQRPGFDRTMMQLEVAGVASPPVMRRQVR